MKNKLKLFIIAIVSFIMFILLNINNVDAASANISGKTSVQKGESVTITASVNAGAWNLTLSGAGQSVKLVGQTNTTGNASDSKSITFTANSDTTFTLTGDITDFSEDNSTSVSKSTTVKVSQSNVSTTTATNNVTTTSNTGSSSTTKTEDTNKKSSNANLSNLGIKPNDFSGFKAAITTYNVTVPADVEEVEVYATAQDLKAKVSGTGKKQLEMGNNTATVTVTAEDGTKKTYTINIARKESEEDAEEKNEETNTEEIQEEGNNVATYQVTENKSLVDEETLNQEQKAKEEKQKNMIIGAIVAVIILAIIIFLIIRHKRNKNWENEYSIPFSEINDDENNQLEEIDEDWQEDKPKKRRHKGKRFK